MIPSRQDSGNVKVATRDSGREARLMPIGSNLFGASESDRVRGTRTVRVLDSSVRREMLELIRSHPGMTVRELLEEMQVGWGTLYHHLTVLERSELVRCVVSGRRRLLYLTEQGPVPKDTKERSVLAGSTARKLGEVIAANEGLGIEAIVQQSGVSPRVAYYHIKRLLEAGLVKSDSSTRYRGLVATDHLRRLLSEGAGAGRAEPQ